ncbi:MAG: hypothetical protein O3B31_00090 [Chloroflexi bacterium]|nr:hypothetical protein [Chloroflexota bacterium]
MLVEGVGGRTLIAGQAEEFADAPAVEPLRALGADVVLLSHLDPGPVAG